MAKLEEEAEKTRTGFMCMIDFDHELGASPTPSKVYTTERALIADHDCAESCGIVEVTVTVKRVVHPPEEYVTWQSSQ